MEMIREERFFFHYFIIPIFHHSTFGFEPNVLNNLNGFNGESHDQPRS